jgi:hypothetical protein
VAVLAAIPYILYNSRSAGAAIFFCVVGGALPEKVTIWGKKEEKITFFAFFL